MPNVGRISEFDVVSGSWSTYIERVEQYFVANEVGENLKVATLIASVGDAAYELMDDLCSPKKPKELKFVDLVEVVRKHLQPTPSLLAERYKFRKRVQEKEENVAQFAASLKHLGRTCVFKDKLEENLRDQFVCGLSSEAIRQRLFCEGDPSYTDAYKLAISLEAAAKDAATVEQQSKVTEGAVQALRAGPASRGGGGGGSGLRRRAPGGGGSSGSPRAGGSGGTTGAYQCFSCGGKDHVRSSCKFKEYTCRVCLQAGHLARVCQSGRQGRGDRQVLQLEQLEQDVAGASGGDAVHLGAGVEDGPGGLYMVRLRGSEPIIADVEVAGRTLRMHVDTGSPISCISADMFGQYFCKHRLQKDGCYDFKGYDGQAIKCVGHFDVSARFGNITKVLKLYVIENGAVPLLGRLWLKELQMDVIVVNALQSASNERKVRREVKFDINSFVVEYPSVFSGQLGKLRSQTATLRLRQGAQPVFRRARPLPLALRGPVDTELQRMEAAGIISPVQSSDWASCLVVVLKSNGSIRICGDYKSTVNPVLEVDKYPLPRAEVLFNNLNGGQRFSKIDLSEAYSQVCLDESKKFTVVNTHRGLYVYNRLVFGLASAPSIFQRMIEQIMGGIPYVSCFLDDILITGPTEEEHVKNLHTVFERLEREGLTVRKEKCEFFAKEVRYLGFVISEQGVKADESKVEAMLEAPAPTNVTELKSFLGMVNFYSKFVNNFSSILTPLYELLKKEVSWSWCSEHEAAFKQIKVALSTCPVLMHYDERLPLVVSCDASARGVGAVLSQRTADGERPVCYASRTLSAAEANYSQIQREALAIVFAIKKFHSYVYGRRFTLRTDHQPLTTIFGCKKDLPHTASGRLIRWAILLSGYQYDIEYIRSAANMADGLSRLPVEGTKEKGNEDETFIKFIEDNLPIDAEEIRLESRKDRCISRALEYAKSGWPASGVDGGAVEGRESELVTLWRRREQLTVEGGCLMWGCRVLVPATLRTRVLAELHGAHLGMVKCKGLARSFVWWPGLDDDIEKMCAACRICAETADLPPRSTVVPWTWPARPFQRVHIDFFYFNHCTYLVLIDGHSKWIEVELMSSTTAANTIKKLRSIFARFGLPTMIVSDNGPPFKSEEFLLFLKKNGIKQVTSAPFQPSSNGEAEIAVRIVKKALTKGQMEKLEPQEFLPRFLMDYRNSVHSTTGETPARLMLGRSLRTRLDLLKEGMVESVSNKLQNRAIAKEGAIRHWEEGDSVWARDFRDNRKWAKSVVLVRKGSNMYEVRTEDGLRWTRHADQLRSCSVPAEASVRVTPTPVSVRVTPTPVSVLPQAALGAQVPDSPRSVRTRRPVLRYGIDY